MIATIAIPITAKRLGAVLHLMQCCPITDTPAVTPENRAAMMMVSSLSRKLINRYYALQQKELQAKKKRKESKLKLNYPDAWALEKYMRTSIEALEGYELTACQSIMNHIHQEIQ